MRRSGLISLLATLTTLVTVCVGFPACSDDRVTFVGAVEDGGQTTALVPDGAAPVAQPCAPTATSDIDGDGFTSDGGDCDDCDANVNPGAFDIAGNGRDEDCSGTADDEPTTCDGDIAIDSLDAFDAARALGLCRRTTADATGKARTWGVTNAAYMLPDGAPEREPLSHGILSGLGAYFVPFEGARMLSLSSGYARPSPDLTFEQWLTSERRVEKKYMHGAPPGFPHAPPACPQAAGGQPYDGEGFEVTIRVPTNARSFTFSHAFLTSEYPEWYCSQYNDVYVVIMTPKPTRDGNIAFDRDGNTVSVNSALLDICRAYDSLPVPCSKGTELLTGTGFEGHAATSWLTTSAPVVGGSEIKLFFTVWDSSDGGLDSQILADDFRWSAEAASEPVTRVR